MNGCTQALHVAISDGAMQRATLHWAWCSCGWRGPEQPRRVLAQCDADDHEAGRAA